MNQIRYRTPLASCDLNTRIFSKMCVCSNLWRVKSLGERESSGFGRHRILLPPQIGQLAPPRFYFIIRQINWIRVKSRQQTHEASNFGFNFWPCNHSWEQNKVIFWNLKIFVQWQKSTCTTFNNLHKIQRRTFIPNDDYDFATSTIGFSLSFILTSRRVLSIRTNPCQASDEIAQK